MDDLLIRVMQLGHQGYSCSQILMLLGLAQHDHANPELIRAMDGLAYGCGTGEASCGVLTSGCCLLALYAGRDESDPGSSSRLPPMCQELVMWFTERAGGLRCDAITGSLSPGLRQSCGPLLVDTFRKTLDILNTHGIDPAYHLPRATP